MGKHDLRAAGKSVLRTAKLLGGIVLLMTAAGMAFTLADFAATAVPVGTVTATSAVMRPCDPGLASADCRTTSASTFARTLLSYENATYSSDVDESPDLYFGVSALAIALAAAGILALASWKRESKNIA